MVDTTQYWWNLLINAFKNNFVQTQNVTPSPSGIPGSPATQVAGGSYPVSVQSPPQLVLQAMKDSGYLAQLQAEGSPEVAAAQNDPVGQLSTHPYLFSAFPAYFKQV